jgi:hypothetical protein
MSPARPLPNRQYFTTDLPFGNTEKAAATWWGDSLVLARERGFRWSPGRFLGTGAEERTNATALDGVLPARTTRRRR